MEKIGQYLKNQRVELGFTLEEMSQKTKISVPQLNEMENGNLDFFAGDITYLPFMIKAYARALYLDMSDIKDDVDNLVDKYYYTQEIKLNQKLDEIHESVSTKRHTTPTKASLRKEFKKQKLEFSQLTLILIVLFIIISTVILTISFVLPALRKEDNPKPPVVDLPQKPSDQDEEPQGPNGNSELKELVISQANPTTYLISDYQVEQEVTLKLTFNARTWIRVYLNDTPTDNPISKIYQPNEHIEVIVKAHAHDKVMFHVGVVRSNEFRINDVLVELDETIANLNSGSRITFEFEGD